MMTSGKKQTCADDFKRKKDTHTHAHLRGMREREQRREQRRERQRGEETEIHPESTPQL